MTARRILVAVFILAFCLLTAQLFAEDTKFDINDGMREILKDQVGKRVSIRLDAGEDLEGTVLKVGDQLVQISKLSRRDFYDALVRIDRINAIIIKVREK